MPNGGAWSVPRLKSLYSWSGATIQSGSRQAGAEISAHSGEIRAGTLFP
jgi:hypothetical protein